MITAAIPSLSFVERKLEFFLYGSVDELAVQSASFGRTEREPRASIGRVTYIRDREGSVFGDGVIVPSKLSRKVFPRLFDALQRGHMTLALNAVHTESDFVHKILHRLQIVGISDRVFLICCTIAVEGGVSVVTRAEGGLIREDGEGGRTYSSQRRIAPLYRLLVPGSSCLWTWEPSIPRLSRLEPFCRARSKKAVPRFPIRPDRVKMGSGRGRTKARRGEATRLLCTNKSRVRSEQRAEIDVK